MENKYANKKGREDRDRKLEGERGDIAIVY